MRTSMRNGCVIFTLAVLVAGCGAKAQDKLMKDRIEILNSMAAEFEKVTDKASFANAMSALEPLGKQLDTVEKEFAALTPEAKEAAQLAHKAELDQVTARFAAAKEKAGKKGR